MLNNSNNNNKYRKNCEKWQHNPHDLNSLLNY